MVATVVPAADLARMGLAGMGDDVSTPTFWGEERPREAEGEAVVYLILARPSDMYKTLQYHLL